MYTRFNLKGKKSPKCNKKKKMSEKFCGNHHIKLPPRSAEILFEYSINSLFFYRLDVLLLVVYSILTISQTWWYKREEKIICISKNVNLMTFVLTEKIHKSSFSFSSVKTKVTYSPCCFWFPIFAWLQTWIDVKILI